MSTTPAKGSNNLQAVVARGAHHASFSTEFVNDVFRFASRYVVPLGFGQHIEQGCGGAGFVLKPRNDVENGFFLISHLPFLARLDGGEVEILAHEFMPPCFGQSDGSFGVFDGRLIGQSYTCTRFCKPRERLQ